MMRPKTLPDPESDTGKTRRSLSHQWEHRVNTHTAKAYASSTPVPWRWRSRAARIKGSDRLLILARRQRVAGAYLHGQSQWEIAQEEGVDHSTVSRDLAAIRQDWRASAVMDLDAKFDEELAKLDEVEREAWAAWRESKTTLHTHSREEIIGGRNDGATRTTEKRQQRCGDPAFLQIILQCLDRRCKLLQLQPAQKPHIIGDKSAPPHGVPTDVENNVNGDFLARMEQFGALYDRMVAEKEAAVPPPDDDGDTDPVDPG